MRVGFLITARLKSTRLPEKLLREVCGRPIFAHLLDRAKQVQAADVVVVCTSTHPQDDPLMPLAREEGVESFRGDEEDVLRRLSDAAAAFDLDYILNITADCPLVDPAYADAVVDAYRETGAHLIRALDLPHGAFSYGIDPAALAKVCEIKDDVRTEVWGSYFTDTDLFDVHDLRVENPRHRRPGLRMTLDYPEDLEFLQAVFDALYQPGEVFRLDDVLDFLDEQPQIVEINRHRGADYARRWTKQSSIRLKPRYDVRRAAILGCGSIGQRHIRNLRQLGLTEITALRSLRGHHQELDPALEVREVNSWDDLLATEPDVAIVANPSSLHLEVSRRLAPHVRGLFIEKPLAVQLDGVSELLADIAHHRCTSFVGYSLEFHPVARILREQVADGAMGAPLVLQGQVGQWLPDWHPYEDYRKAYYARRDLGGGAILTLIHELNLALQLLGSARSVSCLLPEYNDLAIDVEAVADLMIEHESGAVSQIHLDFVQRPTHRSGTLSFERGWLRYDFIRSRVVLDAGQGPQTVLDVPDYDANQAYVDEIATFLQYVREGRVRHDFDAWRGAASVAVASQALAAAGVQPMETLEH